MNLIIILLLTFSNVNGSIFYIFNSITTKTKLDDVHSSAPFSKGFGLKQIKIQGTFKYCTNIAQYFNVKEMCIEKSPNKKQISKISEEVLMGVYPYRFPHNPATVHVAAYVLEKSHRTIMGKGFLCKRKVKTIQTWLTVFGYEMSNVIENKMDKLTKLDCEFMVKSKTCVQNVMACNNDDTYCSYSETPELSYSRFIYLTYTYYNCELLQVPIEAENVTSQIITLSNLDVERTSSCLGEDLFCQFKDGIVIWDKLIFHICAFTKSGPFSFNYSTQHALLISDSEHLSFKLTKIGNICENKM